MKISFNWLREFVKIPYSVTPKKLGELLTLHTAEVEEVVDAKATFEKIVVGKINALRKHPGADKLTIVEVDIGQKEAVQIVCGGQNLVVGMSVAAALPGSWVRWHGEGEPVQLEEVKLRGEKSFGMICAGEEIGLETDNPAGAKEVRIHDLSHLQTKPGTPLAKALGKDDVVLDIDNKSLTHRPDLWGHYGIAREVAAILKKPLKRLSPLFKYDKGTPKKSVKITLKTPKDCPRFSACVITGIHVTESPQWIQARLQAAGMRPINNIVDLTNMVMLELGQPMHAYDRSFVGTDALLVRHAIKDETLTTLDHKKRKLHGDDLLICTSKNEPLGLAGVMGGLHSEITEKTTEIILESANFNPVTIRKTSTRHALRSDASQRFEKGLDPTLTDQAIERFLHLLQKIQPTATLLTPVTTTGDWKFKKLTLQIEPANVMSKIGADIYTPEMIRILKSLEFGVTKSGKKLNVTVPSHRATGDVDRADDLVEEIARLYGYNRIEPELPRLPTHLPLQCEERELEHRTRTILANELAFNEAMNYSFYGEDLFTKCGLQNLRHIKVFNPLSAEQTHLRVSLIPGLLQSVEKNGHEHDDIKLFELGRTYHETGEFMPLEEKYLCAAIARRKKYEPFYEIKGAFEDFVRAFRPTAIALKPSSTPPPYAHPKKCLDILSRGKVIGSLFELHPATAKNFKLEHRTACLEINFTQLVAAGRTVLKFTPLPKYQGMKFDVSCLVYKKTEVEKLESVIRRADPAGLIQNVELCDMYHGANIPETKKSLTFSVELRHAERTLTDAEFQAAHTAVLSALKKSGAEIRN